MVKLPPRDCVIKPEVPSLNCSTSPAGMMTAFTSLVTINGSLVCPNRVIYFSVVVILLLFRADINVCQLNVAHFILDGKSFTPSRA
jgi:hypothetical protein